MFRNKSYLIALLYAITIGLSPLFLKLIITETNALVIVAHRFLLAMLLVICFNRRLISLTKCLQLLPLALLFPLATFMFQTLALQTATTIQISIIQANVPIIATLGAIFILKEKITKSQMFYVLLSVVGVMLMFMHALVLSFTIGLLYSLIATICWGIYSVYIKKYTQILSVKEISAVIIVDTAIIYNVIALWNIDTYFQPLFKINYLLAISYLAIFATVISMSAAIYITHKLGVSKASVFNNLATIITIVVGAVLLHEAFTFYHFIGTLIVIYAIYNLNKGGHNVIKN